jgi:hypothetical protein
LVSLKPQAEKESRQNKGINESNRIISKLLATFKKGYKNV